MLTKTRSNIERDLSKHHWAFLHLSRLLSSGYLAGRYRSLYCDLIANSTYAPSSPVGVQTTTNTTPPSPTSLSSSSCVAAFGFATQPCTAARHLSPVPFSFTYVVPPADLVSAVSWQQNKVDELERLLGGKDKLFGPTQGRSSLGEFVMGMISVSSPSSSSLKQSRSLIANKAHSLYRSCRFSALYF